MLRLSVRISTKLGAANRFGQRVMTGGANIEIGEANAEIDEANPEIDEANPVIDEARVRPGRR